jgi:hypothetical protein
MTEARAVGGASGASAVLISLLTLADALANESPDGFDRDLFLENCGVFSSNPEMRNVHSKGTAD